MSAWKPLAVEIPYLYDDGSTVHEATLAGEVHPDNEVEYTLTLDATGEEVRLKGFDRRVAEGELREVAHDFWRARGVA